MGGAAELFTRHVFLDLETTGLDPRVDEVIELGALFFENGREVDRFVRLFAASRPLPLTIRRLTGIEDTMLAGKPRLAERHPELRQKLAGWTVVAHNASFEKGFLPDLLGPIRAPVLDSCELLHYLHPELPSHSLEALLRWAGKEPRARHRAMTDCEATRGAAARAGGLRPRGARGRHGGPAGDVDPAPRCGSPRRRPAAGLELEGRSEAGASRLAAHRPVGGCAADARPAEAGGHGLPPRPRPSACARTARSRPPEPDEGTPVQPVTAEEVSALLGPGGRWSAAERLRGPPRPAGDGRRPWRARCPRAGSSRWRPARARASPWRTWRRRRSSPRATAKVGVAPHTKTLQDQLIEKDLPGSHRATGAPSSTRCSRARRTTCAAGARWR